MAAARRRPSRAVEAATAARRPADSLLQTPRAAVESNAAVPSGTVAASTCASAEQEAPVVSVGAFLSDGLPAKERLGGDLLLLKPKDLSLRHLADSATWSRALPRGPAENLLSTGGGLHAPMITARGGGAVPTAAQQPAPRPKKRRNQPQKVPRQKEVVAGWGDLLKEIGSSSRRVRLAKGGHIGARHQSTKLGKSTVESWGGAFPKPSDKTVETLPVAGEGELTEVDCLALQVREHDLGSSAGVSPSVASSSPVCFVDETRDVASQDEGSEEKEEAEEEGAEGEEKDIDAGERTEEETVDEIWRSYRIDRDKVPDSVLSTIWRRAVDPKHCTEEIEQLEKVPRLTVTTRDVQQLPPVNDIQHWRLVNRRRREQRKAKQEAEHYPSLDEMLRITFGEMAPPLLHLHAQKRMNQQTPHHQGQSRVPVEMFDSMHGRRYEDHGHVRSVVEQEMLAGAFPEHITKQKLTTETGFIAKGRRAAFDEGQPWTRNNAPLAEAAGGPTQQRNLTSELLRNLDLVRGESDDSEKAAEHLNRLATVAQKVQERCCSKVRRMQVRFLRKQAQLSSRLRRRVKRLQMDFEEIHDMKVGSILPSVVTQDTIRGGPSSPQYHETVLRYLKRHRCIAERERQSRHDVYERQVEKLQGYLRLLADPNRVPERGEIYLTECFRHVLAGGLIVDDTFFFRVIERLDHDDFEKVATVNLLAACCDSFEVDLSRYRAFLEARGFPFHIPRPRPDQVRSWEDWAPWCGVDLDIGNGEEDDALTEERIDIVEDPLGFFMPIVPEGAPDGDTGLVSREDPLGKVLSEMSAFDMVLSRYKGPMAEHQRLAQEARKRLAETVNADEGSAELTTDCREDIAATQTATQVSATSSAEPSVFPTVAGMAAGPSSSVLANAQALDVSAGTAAALAFAVEAFRSVGALASTPPAPLRPTAAAAAVAATAAMATEMSSGLSDTANSTPVAPPPPGLRPIAPAIGSRRAPARPGHRRQMATGRRVRAVAEPLGELPGAPPKDRPRSVGQAPTMATIAEVPKLELLA